MRLLKIFTFLLCLLVSISLAKEDVSIPKGLHYKEIKRVIPHEMRSSFKRAESYLKKNDMLKADQYYMSILTKGEIFYAFWGRAWCQWQVGNLINAKKQFANAYSSCDSIYPFLLNYAEFVLETQEDWNLVSETAYRAYEISQADDALMILIKSGKRLNLKDKALEQLKLITEKFPNNSNAWIFYASLLREMERNEEAVSAAKHAVSLTDDPFQLRLVVFILANNGYFVDAANACQKLSRIAKRSANSYEAWGFLEYKQGHYENAVINYEKALNRDYKIQTLIMLARLNHFYLNKPKVATYYCKAALQADRNLPDAFYLLTEISRGKGDLKSALKYSKIQIELVPDRSQSYYYHGKLLYEKKEYENAVIYLEKAVELNPGMRRYRLVLAKAYAGAGLIEKAQETYDNFIDEPLKDLWKEEEMLKEATPKPR